MTGLRLRQRFRSMGFISVIIVSALFALGAAVAAAGGWKTVETVQRLYQLADGATTLAAVEGRK